MFGPSALGVQRLLRKSPSTATWLAMVLSLIVGCGSATAPHSPSRATARTQSSPTSETSRDATHTITMGQVALRVPTTWTLGKQVTISKFNALTELGAAFPVVAPNADGALNQKSPSPFLSETMTISGGIAHLNITELSASGALYAVSVMVPRNEAAMLRQVASHVTLPPVATATDAVRFLTEQAASGTHWELVSTKVGSDQWLLAQGEPSSGQQRFALFRSTNGGETWGLEISSNAQNSFMGIAGAASVLFWTAQDGVIAELSGWVPNAVLVYRSTDGGKRWSSQRVAILGSPSGTIAPTISQSQGALVIQGQTGDHKTFQVTSADGGKTWAQTK